MVQRYNPDYVMHAARFAPFAREAEHGELVKFSDYEALEAECDALAQRVDILAQNLGNAIWGEQEALQRVNALAVENAALKSKAAELVHEASEVYSTYNATIKEPDGDFMDMQTLYEMQRIETPATDTALSAIEVRALEKFADSELCSQEAHGCVCSYIDELQEAK
ncbi:hypothetical protein D9B84_00620 [Serratia marcescens]|uniref:hypothetical protein n=1 Tax=Serratia marcescens TaxID=615 RepID=UPI000F7ED988|nr:hypothetical protein [Serratia marcescens]RTF27153.1 hypothetical protein D9B84_00620 [Serratia marcescens]